jgi:uncharacterized protein YidB (DUF937 family)
MFLFRIAKWMMRKVAGRAIKGLGGEKLSGVVTSLLGQGGTGLAGLLEKFNKGGLGDLVQSWVGKGANKQLTAEQVKSVLGADTVSGVATHLGTSEDKAASKLAGALPQLVDKLTPKGEVPDQETLAKRLAALLK